MRKERPAHHKTPGRGRPQRFTQEEYAEALRRGDGVRAKAARLLGCMADLVTDACKRFPALLEVEREAKQKYDAKEQDDRLTAFQIARNCHRALLQSAQAKLLGPNKEPLLPSEHKAIYFDLTHSQLGREEFASRTELTGKDGGAVDHKLVVLRREQVARLSDEQIEGILDGDGRLLAETAFGERVPAGGRGAEAQAREARGATH